MKNSFRDSSAVEQSPVKRLVAGSIPAPGVLNRVKNSGRGSKQFCFRQGSKTFDSFLERIREQKTEKVHSSRRERFPAPGANKLDTNSDFEDERIFWRQYS